MKKLVTVTISAEVEMPDKSDRFDSVSFVDSIFMDSIGNVTVHTSKSIHEDRKSRITSIRTDVTDPIQIGPIDHLGV